MNVLPSSARFSLVLGGAVLVATVLGLPSQVPVAVKIALPTIAAVLAGFILQKSVATARTSSDQRAAEAEARLAAQAKIASEVRHDIRGYLSPALLNADRLSTNPDPTVRRAAETMIVTVERIEARLRDA